MVEPVFVGSAASPITCVTATPNFKACFTGHANGVVIEWDWFKTINVTAKHSIQIAQRKTEWNTQDGSTKVPDSISSIVVQSEGVWCLTGHRSGEIKLFTPRLDQGRCHTQFVNNKSPVTGLGIGVGERLAVSVSADGSLSVIDLDSGQSFQFRRTADSEADHHGLGPFRHLKLAAKYGSTIAAATCSDGTVPIWNVRGFAIETVAKIDTTMLKTRASALAWANDVSAIIGCEDGSVSVWDLRNSKKSVTSVESITLPQMTAVKSPEQHFQSPKILMTRNRINAVESLQNGLVAVASVDAVRVIDLSKSSAKKRLPISLFASEGVENMITDTEGRFLFTSCAEHRDNTALGFDITEAVGLSPPSHVRSFAVSAPSPRENMGSDLSAPVVTVATSQYADTGASPEFCKGLNDFSSLLGDDLSHLQFDNTGVFSDLKL